MMTFIEHLVRSTADYFTGGAGFILMRCPVINRCTDDTNQFQFVHFLFKPLLMLCGEQVLERGAIVNFSLFFNVHVKFYKLI